MRQKNLFIGMMAAGVLLVAVAGLWLASASPANAQCGSQASSCKNCHEVQGKMPVNGDGTGWHQSHAFGDFCYICHAGNNQAQGEAEAHAGMVAPLSDVEAACMQCHPADLQERAQVYATALGVEIGQGGAPAPASAPVPASASGLASDPPANAAAAPVSAAVLASPPVSAGLAVDDPNLVDYARRYEEIVLGKRPVNWGNTILTALIGLVVIGGGAFVVVNERRIKVPAGGARKVEGEYPEDVMEMLPYISGLNVHSRKSLMNILEDPARSQKVLGLIEAVVLDGKDKDGAK